MGENLSIVVIILLWLISFVEPSGWAIDFHLPDKINLLVSVAAFVCFVAYPKKRLPVPQSLAWMMLIFLVIVPYVESFTWQGASYMVSILTTYIVSQGKITDTVIKYTSLMIAALGLFVLYVYVHGDILSGWNDNAISMTGLFSYLYFSIYLIDKRDRKSFWFWNVVTVAYLQLLFQTDCRSGMLFSMLAVLAIYFTGQAKKILGSRRSRLFLLNVPLIISLVVISLAASSYFDALNEWSLRNLDKDIFNGRNVIWESAYVLLVRSYCIGTGEFLINYHNSCVAAISVFGVIGYICWIKFFSVSLSTIGRYHSDGIAFGATLAFLLIFLQQSVDLGFICEIPNLLPYTILGIGLGRARLLKRQ